MYQVGCSKVDITNFVYNKGMMGYAMFFNVVKDVKTPIHVRAFVIKDAATGKKVCLVNAEICFYSIAIKHEVVKQLQEKYPELGYTDANLLLSAQHTHSAPGGMSHYLAYNLSIPGFQPKVFNKVVEGTLQAILQAEEKLQDATLHFDTGTFDEDVPVAFNRSITAYNANEEITKKIPFKKRHLAVDRNMKLLYFKNKKGEPIGVFNWFGVHTTSVSNDNTSICYDNKGYASDFLEKAVQAEGKHPDFVAVFAQDSAGDVTPNYKWDFDKYWTRGKYKDDFKSARHNGYLQCQQAEKIIQTADKQEALKTNIDYELFYVDFSNVECDRQFTKGKKGLMTAPPAIGITMLQGTTEGPGVSPPALSTLLGAAGSIASGTIQLYEKTIVKLLFRNRQVKDDIDLKYESHGKKFIILESGVGRILGAPDLQKLVLPAGIDPIIKNLKGLAERGYAKYTPWMPKILPLQIITLGELALIGIAAEITTIASKRLKETALRILKHKGIRHVVIASYSNGYSGYITTPEEYDFQLYEGGHTIFGKWTLPAYQTKLKQLAIEFLKPAEQRQLDRSVQPKIFEKDEIWYGEEVE